MKYLHLNMHDRGSCDRAFLHRYLGRCLHRFNISSSNKFGIYCIDEARGLDNMYTSLSYKCRTSSGNISSKTLPHQHFRISRKPISKNTILPRIPAQQGGTLVWQLGSKRKLAPASSLVPPHYNTSRHIDFGHALPNFSCHGCACLHPFAPVSEERTRSRRGIRELANLVAGFLGEFLHRTCRLRVYIKCIGM